jgi:cardiolipin synthase
MYIIEDDALGRLISDALIARARCGVEVRVIFDDVGCWSVKNHFFERLREEGIEAVTFLPVRFPSFTSKVNYRNHRKLIVIDGETGFMGGMNIAVRYVSGTWRDTMVKITGAGVYALQRSFLIDWYFVDRTLLSDRKYYPATLLHSLNTTPHAHAQSTILQVVTSSPVVPYPEIMQGFVRTILAAKLYVYIETPYFLPTESVLFALKTAAMAGVDVRIMVPLKNDSWFVDWAGRSYLREAAEAGVRVLLHEAGFLHSKMLVCDDSISTCGSTNVDFRSFENNFEANTFFYDEQVALRMRDIFLDDERHSVALSKLSNRLQPTFRIRLLEGLARLFSPLL